jgi:hypothetical protein
MAMPITIQLADDAAVVGVTCIEPGWKPIVLSVELVPLPVLIIEPGWFISTVSCWARSALVVAEEPVTQNDTKVPTVPSVVAVNTTLVTSAAFTAKAVAMFAWKLVVVAVRVDCTVAYGVVSFVNKHRRT